jgi:glycosyltransferase involved in cell wall biosynthesis
MDMNTLSPQFSICICNYNMADTLEESLSSIIDQIDDRFEIIVVDDGSNDGSLEILEQLDERHSFFHLIPLPRDRGRKLGLTRNISIENACGEYVMLHLDCDDIIGPFLKDFAEVFLRIRAQKGSEFLLSGEHVNMAGRDFLLSKGPYRNLYRGEDRDLWSRLAGEESYFPFEHVDFIRRIPKTGYAKYRKAVFDTFDHMCNDFRTGVGCIEYLKLEFQKWGIWSWKLRAFRLAMVIPARIRSFFQSPLKNTEGKKSFEDFAQYRNRMKGTYSQLMERFGGNGDMGFLSEEARQIFDVGKT